MLIIVHHWSWLPKESKGLFPFKMESAGRDARLGLGTLAPASGRLGATSLLCESRARRDLCERLTGTDRPPVPPGFQPRWDVNLLSASRQSAGTHLSAMTQNNLQGGKPV
jgi:hypothetical protein